MLRRLTASDAVLFICDIQERFRPLIHQSEAVINRAALLTKVANELSIPTVVTEQYTKAFGKTVPDISSICLPTTKIFEKKQFSMLTPEVSSYLQTLSERKKVIMCGIEAHVCVLQSVRDLALEGYTVYVVADAVSSQRAHDRLTAIERMNKFENINLTTAESVTMELLGSADHPQFKSVSGLLKLHNQAPCFE